MKIKPFLIFLFIFVGLCLLFLPALINEYMIHDDTMVLMDTPFRPITVFNASLLGDGRYLGWFIFTLSTWVVSYVSDLLYLKLFDIFQYAFIGLICLKYFRLIFSGKFLPFILLAGFFALPPFTVPVFQAGMSFIVTGVLFGAIASEITNNIPARKGWRGITLQALAAVIIFTMAISIHQATAMFFWFVCFISFLTDFIKRQPLRKKFFIQIFVGFTSFILYACLLFAMRPFFGGSTQEFHSPYQININLLNNFKWFIQTPLKNALNLWIVPADNNFAFVVLGLILSAIFLLILKNNYKERVRYVALIGIICLYLTLSFLPNLVAKSHFSSYRCSYGLISIVFIVFFYSLKLILETVLVSKRTNFFLFLVLIFITIGGIFFHYKSLIKYQIQPALTEFKYIKRAMQPALKMEEKPRNLRLHFIMPQLSDFRRIEDEYFMLTSAFEHNIDRLAVIVVRELYKGKKDLQYFKYASDQESYELYFIDKNAEKSLHLISFKLSFYPEDLPFQFNEKTVYINTNELLQNDLALSDLTIDF